MTDIRVPGVYIVEKPGPRPIEAVGTSTAGFVGRAPDGDVAPSTQAQAVVNPTQFNQLFNPGNAPQTDLSRAVAGFFQNGGQRCFVVNLGPSAPLMGPSGTRSGLDLLTEIDEIAIVAAPGFTDPEEQGALLDHCESLRDRVAILDPPQGLTDIHQLLQFGQASADATAHAADEEGETDAGTTRRRSAPPPGGGFIRKSNYGAAYFPWLVVRDWGSTDDVEVPPSGHMAGVWARTDATRGVHKAPANEPIRGIIGLAYRVVDSEQADLNEQGINCIRLFSTEGIKVWGARTLFADPEWKYLNVRRSVNMIEESIKGGTRWVVFEPNDRTLWKSIARDVRAFLTGLWRNGALTGRTPNDAFFVKCDDETNPPDVVDQGQVVITVGIAPVKPAEFVIFNISQTDGVTTASVGGVTNV
jgi:uncharacterized protein